MTAHVHAALMDQYAEDAHKTDHPEYLWRQRPVGGAKWESIFGTPLWSPDWEYSRRPGSLNGHEYPLAETEPPAFGTHYWVPDPLHPETTLGQLLWTGDEFDLLRLGRGLVHLTEDAARAHADAIISAGNGER